MHSTNYYVGLPSVLPEFLLRQVELHVFIFLVLFIQLPQCRICCLIARLLHEGVDILLKMFERMAATR